MTQIRLIIALVSLLSFAGLFAGVRLHYINQGKTICENAANAATQEKVIHDAKILRQIRANKLTIDRTSKRLFNAVF